MSNLDPIQWLLLFVIGLAVLLVMRIPVGLALLIVSLAGAIVLYGFLPGVEMTIVSMVSGLATFTLTAIPMFVLMGELFFRSGIAYDAIRVIDRMLGKLPGRLAFISVGMGALLGVLSGSVMASTAMLGGTLAPQMIKRGYSPRLALGSILGSGGLAMILPPSTVVIVWGATAGVPVGPLLMAGIIPGILMAVGYTIVVAVWSYFLGGAESKARVGSRHTEAVPRDQVSLPQEATSGSAWRSIVSLLGMLAVIFGVLTLIILGIATPTEAAAIAVVATAALLLVLGRLSRTVIATAFRQTLATTGMIFLIIGAAAIYGKVLAGSGSVTAFVTFMTGLTGNSYLLILLMLLIVIILGLFLESIAIVLLTIPLFMPIVSAANVDPIWFGMIMIIAIQIGTVTPPFGMSLFVIRQYAPKSLKMSEIYKAALPFVVSDLAVIGLLLAVPALVTFIPNLM